MALPSFNELREIDVTPYCKMRDGIPYLPWATCKALLHANGATEVFFLPQRGADGSSLLKSDKIFTDKHGNTNQCYETEIEIHIDGNVYSMRSPVMNGANPVKDNSMSQQRVWNSMTRSFVKGVAIYTGLGFNLWAEGEGGEESFGDDDLAKQDIRKVQEKVLETLTTLNKAGMTAEAIAKELGMDEEAFRAQFGLYSVLYKFETDLNGLLARLQ